MTTFLENPPEVVLLTHTPEPLSVMYEVWQTSRDYEVLTPGLRRRQEEVELFRKLVFEFTQIPEMIKFTWWIEGMPRAFFDQLTRYRKTGWFARSQRIRDQRGFSGRGEYLTTPAIHDNLKASIAYKACMVIIDSCYSELIKMGIPAEDARGVLPLHLRTGMAWSTTLRDLTEVFRARTCCLLQQTYWAHVMVQIRKWLLNIDPEFQILFAPPCDKEGKCLSPIEAEARITHILDRDRFDLFPCPIYHRTFSNPATREKVSDTVERGLTQWAKTPWEELDSGDPKKENDKDKAD